MNLVVEEIDVEFIRLHTILVIFYKYVFKLLSLF